MDEEVRYKDLSKPLKAVAIMGFINIIIIIIYFVIVGIILLLDITV